MCRSFLIFFFFFKYKKHLLLLFFFIYYWGVRWVFLLSKFKNGKKGVQFPPFPHEPGSPKNATHQESAFSMAECVCLLCSTTV